MDTVIAQLEEMNAVYNKYHMHPVPFTDVVLCGCLDVWFNRSKYLIKKCIDRGRKIRVSPLSIDKTDPYSFLNYFEAYCAYTRHTVFSLRIWQYFNSLQYLSPDNYKLYMCNEMDYATARKWTTYIKKNNRSIYNDIPHNELMKKQFLEDKHIKLFTCLMGLSKMNDNGIHHGSIMRRRVVKYAGL